MKLYQCHKKVRAKPMTRGEFVAFRYPNQKPNPDAGAPEDPGYLIEYLDSPGSVVEGFENYVSWSPKDVFENGYTEIVE